MRQNGRPNPKLITTRIASGRARGRRPPCCFAVRTPAFPPRSGTAFSSRPARRFPLRLGNRRANARAGVSGLPVRVACPGCLSGLPVRVACPGCLSGLPVRVACPAARMALHRSASRRSSAPRNGHNQAFPPAGPPRLAVSAGAFTAVRPPPEADIPHHYSTSERAVRPNAATRGFAGGSRTGKGARRRANGRGSGAQDSLVRRGTPPAVRGAAACCGGGAQDSLVRRGTPGGGSAPKAARRAAAGPAPRAEAPPEQGRGGGRPPQKRGIPQPPAAVRF